MVGRDDAIEHAERLLLAFARGFGLPSTSRFVAATSSEVEVLDCCPSCLDEAQNLVVLFLLAHGRVGIAEHPLLGILCKFVREATY
jgi:hypothetical protein